MTEVKRSLSAIESRNGRNNEASGATYPSLGLRDPAKTLLGAPQTTSQLPPSLAPTPSRTLLSGRISPTSMTASVQGEPSTPTPASRHLSDKSKGKRKAEDIDVTPPEQKKEGQRATFLLPETRSKCHSNSATSQTALSALAQIETKVSASQVPLTLHRRTTASVRAYHQLLLSPPPPSRDHRLCMKRLGRQRATTTSRLSPVAPALVWLLLARLRALHPLVPASPPLPAQPESMNDANPCPKFPFL